MSDLARQQFFRVLQEVSAAHSREAAIGILRGAKFSGALEAISADQFEQLQAVAREIGDGS